MPNRTDRILVWIIVGAIIAAVFVPLYVSQTLFFPFISGKNFAFRILAEIAFAAWLILAFRNHEYRPRKSALLWSIFFFVATLGISTIFAEDSYKSFWSNFERMEGFIGITHFVLYFFVAGAVFRVRDWRRFFHLSLGVSWFIFLYSLLQFFGELTINQGGVRVDATFGNAIYLGVYGLFHVFFAVLSWYRAKQEGNEYPALLWSALLGNGLFAAFFLWRVASPSFSAGPAGLSLFSISFLVFCIALWAVVRRRMLSERIAIFGYGALVLCNVILVVLSATRGALLGLFVGIVVGSTPAAFSRGAGVRIRRIGFAGVAVAILAVGSFFVAREVPYLRAHPVFGRILSASPVNDDAQARFVIWEMSWKGFKERPLFGWGQEGFNFVFNKHYDARLYHREAWFDRAHNAYLDWLIAGGLFGIAGYLALWYFAARSVLRGKNTRGGALFSSAERALFVGFGTAYAVNNVFVFDNGVSHFLFFMLLAYVHFRATEDTAPVLQSVIPDPRGAVARMCTPAAVVVLAFSLYWFNARPAYAGALLLDALRAQKEGPAENLALFRRALGLNTLATAEIREQLAQVTVAVAPISGVPITVKQEFLSLAASELDKEIKKRPTDARYYTFLASLLDSFGLYEQGFLYWREAVALSPRKQALLFQMGSNRLNAGKAKESVSYFKTAYELNMKNRDAVVIYAVGFIYAGDRDGEKKILTAPAYADGWLPEPRLLSAYAANGRMDEVVALWRAQSVRDPKNGDIHLRLAEALFVDGAARSNAIAEVRRGVEIDASLSAEGESIIKKIQETPR